MKDKIKDNHGNEFELLTVIEGVGVYFFFGDAAKGTPVHYDYTYAITVWHRRHDGYGRGNQHDWGRQCYYLIGGKTSFQGSNIYDAGYPREVEKAILEFVNTHHKLRT